MRMVQLLADQDNAVRPGQVTVGDVARWQESTRERAAAALEGFVRDRCAEHVRGIPGADFVSHLLASSVSGGKYVRSTFIYLGWRCGAGEGGAGESDAALRAAPAWSCCTPSRCCRTT